MSFEAIKNAPEHLKRKMLEAGQAHFRDTSSIKERKTISTDKKREEDLKTGVIESVIPKTEGDEENINRRAALEGLVLDSGISWTSLNQKLSEKPELRSKTEELAKRYLGLWRRTDSGASKEKRACINELMNEFPELEKDKAA